MFTEKERILANEAALTASLLGNGLNSLRRADMYNKGLYYQAFFSLSIGIERLLKIIVVGRYRCEHDGEFPANINLRKFGHDLLKLCEYVEIKFDMDSVHLHILSFLNEFAKKNRYYNIDSMLDMSIHCIDPLKEWDFIAETIVQLSNKKKSIQNREVLSNMLDSVADIHFYDLRGNEITSSSQILDELEVREVTQSYSVQYVFQIITKLIEQIRKLERKKYLMPVLSEFFPLYHSYWRPFEIRRKKDWCRI